jgi:hypothetical protein
MRGDSEVPGERARVHRCRPTLGCAPATRVQTIDDTGENGRAAPAIADGAGMVRWLLAGVGLAMAIPQEAKRLSCQNDQAVPWLGCPYPGEPRFACHIFVHAETALQPTKQKDQPTTTNRFQTSTNITIP